MNSCSAGLSRRIWLMPGDVVADVAGPVVVPGLDLVLLGVEVLLPAGDRRALAQLEPVVDAVDRRQRRRQHEARLKARAPAGLQVDRVDVRRVGEEVRPHVLLGLVLGQLGQVLGELLPWCRAR